MRLRTLLIAAAVGGAAVAVVGRWVQQLIERGPYSLEPVTSDFLDSAPVRNTVTARIPANADALFAALDDAAAWPQWLNGIDRVIWPDERGVGTTRTIKMGQIDTEETFFEWEPGRTLAFRFSESGLPIFDAFAERWHIESVSDDACDLEWSYAFRVSDQFQIAEAMIAKAFEGNAQTSLRQLAEYMGAHRDRYRTAPADDA